MHRLFIDHPFFLCPSVLFFFLSDSAVLCVFTGPLSKPAGWKKMLVGIEFWWDWQDAEWLRERIKAKPVIPPVNALDLSSVGCLPLHVS